MILDNIKHADKYVLIHKGFEAAFDFLRTADLGALQPGRFDFGEAGNYAIVEAYTSKAWEDTKWESHLKYLDIQYIIKGSEQMGWRCSEGLIVSEDRLAGNDIVFYESDDELVSSAILNAGDFAVFFPTDVHRPAACVDHPMPVKKIIFKLLID